MMVWRAWLALSPLAALPPLTSCQMAATGRFKLLSYKIATHNEAEPKAPLFLGLIVNKALKNRQGDDF